jgi:transcriptional regulator with PAS, ATPase and Fis domain
VSYLVIKRQLYGATQDKQGLILSAHGGSLFLDEIAELPLNMQVKLLRAVQEKKFVQWVLNTKLMWISV